MELTNKKIKKFIKILEEQRPMSKYYMNHVYPVSHSGTDRDEEIQTQVGLKLPNGDVVWPPGNYKGFPISTPQERNNLLEVLKKSAGDLSFDVNDFLMHYKWVTRKVISSAKEIDVENLSALAGEEESNDNDNDPVPKD